MKKIVILSTMLALLTGCTVQTYDYDGTYSSNQLNRVQKLYYGTIISAKSVKVEIERPHAHRSSGIGTLAGAVLGGYIGNGMGKGVGKRLTTAGGIIGGAMIGNAAENTKTKFDGVELVVELKDGSSIVVVQKGYIGKFYVGQKIKVVSDGQQVRVSPL